jgi:hypothetical protein
MLSILEFHVQVGLMNPTWSPKLEVMKDLYKIGRSSPGNHGFEVELGSIVSIRSLANTTKPTQVDYLCHFIFIKLIQLLILTKIQIQ